MRRYTICVALTWLGILILGAGCSGDDRIQNVDGIAFAGPESLDFGRVGLGATVKKSVVVRNGSRAPLLVEDVSIDGDDPAFSVRNLGSSRLKEAKSTKIEVSFAPSDEGEHHRTLTIRTDDPERRSIEVMLQGVGVRPHVVADPLILDFGIIELGVPITLPVSLENAFDIEVEAQLGVRGDDQFTASPVGSVRVTPLSTREVQATFLPQRVGKVEGELAILPCPSCDEIVVRLIGEGIKQALVVKPAEVDFGYIPVERRGLRSFEITNVSSYPIDVESMEAELGRAAFAFAGFTGTIAPGQTITIDVEFSPTQIDLDEDWIEIVSTSTRAPLIRVHLLGRGGGPQVQITPTTLDFGSVPLGARGQRDLIVTNAGTDAGAPPLEILEIRVEGPTSELFGPDRDLDANPVSLPAGSETAVRIGYEPTAITSGAGDQATLVVVTNDQSFPEIRIPMRGSAFSAPPCTTIEISPPHLDFGSFDVGWGGVLSIRIFNPGDEMCILRNLRIAEGSDPAFSTWPVESFLIEPGHWFGWMVAFDPHAVGAGMGYHRGELEVFVVNGTQERYAIPLVAGSEDGCLSVKPNFLDFGTDQTGCGEKEGSVHVSNLCTFEVEVGSIGLGAQSHEGEFELRRAPTTPLRLGPGEGFDVGIRWNTEARGINTAPLFIGDSSRALPLTVPVIGELLRDGSTVDRFIQKEEDLVDVLLVVDNSNSMVEEQPRLERSVRVLIDEAERRGVDYHIGVTSSGITEGSTAFSCPGGANGNEAGRLFPVDGSRPRIITPTTSDGRRVLAENTQVGYCHELEQGLEAMRLALSEPLTSNENRGFLRSTAGLAVIFVADEDDHSGFPVSAYIEFLRRLKGEGGAVASAIVDTGEGCPEGAGLAERIIEVGRATGGVVASLCASDWSAIMRRIAERSFRQQGPLALTARPDRGGVRVTVDGREVPAANWTHDRSTNTIRFHRGSEPKAGAVIEVHYTSACD